MPAQTFTMESARSLPLTGALCAVIAIETAALHLLLWSRHPWIAWTLTALSLWTVVWLIGDYRAIGARPVVLESDFLLVRLGRRFQARVPLSEIARAEAPSWRDVPPKGSPGYLKLSGPGSPNVLLTFVRPVEFRGPAGIRKSFTRVGLRLDQPGDFLRSLEAALPGAA
ncbi:MAG TPA: hypothetical protein VFR03_15065 [Thermoanaerobaculia bacterium]|nr:hypothetical protein [Thermoanaerobaculia bacterium]